VPSTRLAVWFAVSNFLREFYPPDDSPEHHHARVKTLMAGFLTCGIVLWIKFLILMARLACSC
jgi:hypothetical protein